jgi:polar amino acid transport system substrate-binding protein
MKQLTQKLKDGSMGVLDVAAPNVGEGMVLVQNHYSLISAGTEGGTASTARKSLIGKAKERPQQVKQVVDTLKQQGPVQTYRAVMKKLDSYSPLGYSSAGVVVDVGPDVKGFSVGDRVACAGAGYANHAEVVSVPANLCVKLQDNADLSLAAYNTLGAIALQGVRQADLRVGETCVVIGLGLLGQLTGLILKASGIKVIGLDINSRAIEIARQHCIDLGFEMDSAGIVDAVGEMSGGIGADGVIITAATSSTQPINLAGTLLRKRGTVVVVGDVPTGFEREPDYYKKELSLKMSCSYGPGRYDIDYEEKGIDYPAGYVRWTENRNMQAFQDLIHTGKIDISYLTTHRFSLDDAPKAYDLILDKSEEFLGIIIEYEKEKEVSRHPVFIDGDGCSSVASEVPGIGFIGAGSYAMSHLLPNLPSDGSIGMTGVMTSSGTSSRSVADKFGFSFCASSALDVVNDAATSTVFIATRHDTHAEYVNSAITSGKNVFVEKPLCLNRDELDGIVSAWNVHKPLLMVGFNRRFSPLAQKIKAAIGDGNMAMIYRVNAGQIPSNTWMQDDDLGGGRVVGEVCHFIDFMVYMNGSLPTKVHAAALKDAENLSDTLNISLTFSNGSIGTICYFANGPKSFAKEYVEIYKGGMVAILRDYKELEIHGSGRPVRKKLLNQDKGQKVMVDNFIQAVKGVGVCPISMSETYVTTLATFKVLESLRLGQAVSIDDMPV